MLQERYHYGDDPLAFASDLIMNTNMSTGRLVRQSVASDVTDQILRGDVRHHR